MSSQVAKPAAASADGKQLPGAASWLVGATLVALVGASLVAYYGGGAGGASGQLRSGGGAFFECGAKDREHFSVLPARGLHILTLDSEFGGGEDVCATAAGALLRIKLHVDGMAANASDGTLHLEANCAEPDLGPQLKNAIASRRAAQLERMRSNGQLTVSAYGELSQRDGIAQTWGFYTADGHKLFSSKNGDVLRALQACGVIYAYEGGNYIIPGVRVGHSRTVKSGDSDELGSVTLTTLSLQPLIFSIEPLLTIRECDKIIKQAKSTMVDSHVEFTDRQGDHMKKQRTSTQAWLPQGGGSMVTRIEKRAHSLLRLPAHYGETLQVLRYTQGQKYDAHHDYFDPGLYREQPDMLQRLQNGQRNRLCTLLWYMKEPKAGGETHFPRAGGLPQPPSFQCTGAARQLRRGLAVKPKRGLATLFYNLRPDGAPDPFSLHCGQPPASGVKWAVNKWVWSRNPTSGPYPAI